MKKIFPSLPLGWSWRCPLIVALLICITSSSFGQSSDLKQTVLLKIAAREYNPTFSAVAASILTSVDTARAYRQLDTLLSREYGDMFWMTGCAGLYFSCKDILPDSYKQKIRECWKYFTPYRGDTDNHFLMYYGSLFLFSQEWDSLDGSEWFLGRSSEEIKTESRQWLEHWLHETVKYGHNEFDSPRYLYYYLTPLLLLSEYSRDTVVASDCEVMINLLLSQYALQSVNGSYGGAHSRQSNDAALVGKNAECLSYGEFFFEDSVTHLLPDLAFAAAGNFVTPEIIKTIAHSRSKPFEYFQTERSRRRIRFEKPPVKSVRKYTYMTRNFSLGSIEGNIIQPIQQQSWSLILNTKQPYNTITGLYPYHSATELGTFFPEEPSFMLEKIEGVKSGYTSPDKFVGGSPYETIWQRKNELRCSYELPDDIQPRHVDLFIPGWGTIVECDSTIWHQLSILYGTVQVIISTEHDFSVAPAPGGYRVRLKLNNGKTSYWIIVKTASERVVEGRDPYMFSGDGIYRKFDSKWRIRSPFVNLRYGSTSFELTDGENKLVCSLSKVSKKPTR